MAVAAAVETTKRVARVLIVPAVGVAKNAVGLLVTAVPGKFWRYQSKATNKNSLSFTSGPPTPKPAILRQFVGLKLVGVNTPGEVWTAIWVKGLAAPQTLSRSK